MSLLLLGVGKGAAGAPPSGIGARVDIGTFLTGANSDSGSLTVASEIPAGATVFGFVHIGSNNSLMNIGDEDAADWDAANGSFTGYDVFSDRIYFFQRKLLTPLAAESAITFTKNGSARMHGVAQYVTGLADSPVDLTSTGTTGTDGAPTNTIDPTAAVSQLIVTGTVSVFGGTDVFGDDPAFGNALALASNSSIRMSSKLTSSGDAANIVETLTNGGSASTRQWLKLSAVLKGA